MNRGLERLVLRDGGVEPPPYATCANETTCDIEKTIYMVVKSTIVIMCQKVQWYRVCSNDAKHGIPGTNPAGHMNTVFDLLLLRGLETLFSMLANGSISLFKKTLSWKNVDWQSTFFGRENSAGYHMRQFLICLKVAFLQWESDSILTICFTLSNSREFLLLKTIGIYCSDLLQYFAILPNGIHRGTAEIFFSAKYRTWKF